MALDYKKELEGLIEYIVKEGGSDLHLSVGHQPTLRLSGSLIPLVKMTRLTPPDTIGFLEELLTADDKKLFFDQREIDFSYNFAII